MTEVPTGNYLIDCQLPHAEVIDKTTRDVWQSVEPISQEEFTQLALPDGMARVGLGIAVMDKHYFRQSPGAQLPGPVTDRTIDGRRFIHCAIPSADGPHRPNPTGPTRLIVDKHHTIIFAAGSKLTIIRTDSGIEYVQVIQASPQGGGLLQEDVAQAYEFELPSNWHLRFLPLAKPAVIHLPNPTEAWFFANGASFQGPVTLPD